MIQLLRKCLYIFQLKVIPQSVKNLVLCGYWNHIMWYLPLFFFTIYFCMFCVSLMFYLMALLRSCFIGKVFACFLLFLPRCCCGLAPSYICVSLGNFYLRFLDFHSNEIRRGMIWMHQEIKRKAKIMINSSEKIKVENFD